jgi:hydrophobe/amphiphile efflux-1 (HAE1) family protein
MNISAPFIRRPVATSLLTAALLLYGFIAFRELPVASLPEVAYPVIQVEADLPGANADTQASAIATPLERMFGRIAGVNQMTSQSKLGKSQLVLQFDLDRDIDAAARDVQAAINAARGQLPANMPTNPTWRKINPAEAPVMVLALTSPTVTKEAMFDVADSILAQKLQQIEGVGQVQVGGSSQPAVRAEVNPLQLSKLGISLDQVRASINVANAHSPKGSVADLDQRILLNTNDQLFRADDYGKLVIAYNNNAPVRLSDVATVVDGQLNIINAGLINGKPMVELDIYRQPSANIIETVDRVKAVLPMLRASISPAITLIEAQDRTITIRASVHDVEITLVIAVVLVILVIFAFLHSVWATAIPSVAVPLSLVGTFGVMYLLGYTIDNLSLMALTISTGFVVDDAIVVIENITRYLEKGMAPLEAALEGSKEIGFTVLSMSLSLIAVFIPILLMSGILGRIFREFAITLSVAVGISLVVSLTTTPMMCAYLLKKHQQDKRRNFLSRGLQSGFDSMADAYAGSLRWVLKHQPLMLALLLGTIGLAVYLYTVVPKGFFPQQDTGRLSGQALSSEDTSFQTMRQKLSQYISILQSDPAVAIVTGNIGARSNQASFNVTLKPLSERKFSADQVINRLRPRLARVPGSTLFLQAVQDVTIGGRLANAQFQYTLQGDNFKDLLEYAPRMLEGMKAIPVLRDVSTDLQNHGLMAGLVIDRDTASRLGLNPQTIDNTLYDAFGQREVSTMYKTMNQYFVVMEVDPQFQQGPDALKNLYLRSATGQMVPLSAFSHYDRSATALSISHQGPFPAVTFSFNMALGASLGEGVAAIQKLERNIELPSTIRAGFQGTTQAFQASLNSQPYLILAALVTVYIVLGILYENYIHPITILSTLPSAGVGALLAVLVTHSQLDIIALIGIILLIGIVKKNAILMIDFAIQAERNEDNSPEESIYQACLLRFRPIMMTTMAALFGGIPIAISRGNGAELRRPLGIAIVGGLIVSQMLTLYTTPVIYLYMDRLRAWISGGKMHALDVVPPKTSAAD